MAATERKSLEPWLLDSIAFYPHQIEGVRDLARRNSFLLADDMGLGKSLQALTVFTVDVVRGWARTALVVAPVTLKGNWQDEIEKFTRFPAVVLNGTKAQREKQIIDFVGIEGPKIMVVNYEQVVAHYDTLDALKFDVAIFDECHYLKNPKAKRTKACLSLYSRRSFMLTGTPMLNHVDELWSILHRIDPKAYPKYWGFLNRYAVFGGYKDKQIVGVKNEKELTERLQGVMLRRLKQDVLDLPDVQIIERRVDLLPQQRKLYDEVANEMRLPQPDGADPQDIENALTKFLRLKQICGTTLPFTGEDHSGKLDLATEDDLELLENGHRLVVFTQFRDVQAAYAKRIAAMTNGDVPIFQLHGDIAQTERQPTVKTWSSTTTPGVIVCMLQVAGVGLNMVAARHGSFIDELFVPGLNKQAIDRLHRIGQNTTQPVQIRKYICRNTIENRVQQILRTKSKLFGEIVESDPDWKRKLLKVMMEDEE
jgi:SNF2 family DNA or RNA helicase